MKQPYDWNRRPLGSHLPRGSVGRGSLPRKKPEAPPPDRTPVRIIVACVVVAVGIAIVAGFVLRGTSDPKVARKPEAWDWAAAKEDLLADPVETPVEAAPVLTPAESPEIKVSPPVAVATAPRAPPEPAPPPRESAPAAKKATKSAPKVAKVAAPKSTGENRFCALELSGTVGAEELDPRDSQTWARLSHFLREEARSPHFLVYPDGSVPASMAVASDGDAAQAIRRVEVPEPDGDPEQPTYRLVVAASASEGSGVKFYNQRLASTYRSQVSCRIEKRNGDSWKLLRSVVASESMNPSKDSGGEPSTHLRRVYDAAFEKLLKQLAGQPPFAQGTL